MSVIGDILNYSNLCEVELCVKGQTPISSTGLNHVLLIMFVSSLTVT